MRLRARKLLDSAHRWQGVPALAYGGALPKASSLTGRWVTGMAGAALLVWGIHQRGLFGAAGIWMGVVLLHRSLAARLV